LAGLFEGDGYYSGSRISICFHENDKHFAYRLAEIFKWGYVYKIPNKKAVD